MRLLICGDRKWNDYPTVLRAISETHDGELVEVIIEGGARGADEMAGWAAEKLGIPLLVFEAEWKKYGRSAGPKRNQIMLVEGQPTYWLAFHNDLDKSKGTKDMVSRLRKAGIPGEVITTTEEVKK